ncbi:MAG: FtsK/SpoIIIE domain-containing protein [Caldilineaceae bacterium]
MSDALRRSSPKAFLMGQAADGSQAIFDLDAHHNLGIIGSPGTGKSHGSGYQLVLSAIGHGYHVIILDPKGGVDFGMFANAAEWQETDPWLLRDQLSALSAEHERRIQLLRSHNASNMWELNGHAPPRVMTVIEEYGALQEDLQASNPKAANQVDHLINKLMRTGRATGLHFCLLDQDTEFWSNAVRGAAKCRLVYKVDEGEAARIREYTAPDLPDRGAFLLRKNEYRAWHVQPKVRQLLTQLPALSAPRLLAPISSERRDYTAADANRRNGWEALDDSADEATSRPTDQQTKWQTLIENWFGENPDALHGPATGISDIARRMAAAEGNQKDYTNYKGIASQLYHEYRQAHADSAARNAADLLRQHGFVDKSVTMRPGGTTD